MFDIKLFVCCHQQVQVPKHPLLVPIQVGTALADSHLLGYLHDDTGDNISAKNRSYCELTAQYWAWKNVEADYYGFFHYRRYLYPDIKAKLSYRVEREASLHLLDKLGYAEFERLIRQYDVIVPKGEDMYVPVREHYAKAPYHHQKDLELAEQIVKEHYPEMILSLEAYFSGTVCYFGNIYIMCRSDGIQLGQWLSFLKTKRKQNVEWPYLTRERIAALDRLGMVWDVDKFLWEQKFEMARKYFQMHGNLHISNQYVTQDGTCLGAWIRSARDDYRTGRLDEASIQRLEAIGMIWDVRQMQWERNYQAAWTYYLGHGHLRVEKGYLTPDGISLESWIGRLRKWYKQNRLTAEQIKRLEMISMVWDGISDRWERNYQAATDYYREHGDLRVPSKYVSADGLNLGTWIKSTRRAYRNGYLGKEQIDRLEQIGMVWGGSGQSGKSELNGIGIYTGSS